MKLGTDPTTGSVTSTQLWGEHTKTYAYHDSTAQETDRDAKRKAAKADAELFYPLSGDVDANVVFQVAFGLLNLHVTMEDGLGDVSFGKGKIAIHAEGRATVEELSVLGFIDWGLVMDGSGVGEGVESLGLELT